MRSGCAPLTGKVLVAAGIAKEYGFANIDSKSPRDDRVLRIERACYSTLERPGIPDLKVCGSPANPRHSAVEKNCGSNRSGFAPREDCRFGAPDCAASHRAERAAPAPVRLQRPTASEVAGSYATTSARRYRDPGSIEPHTPAETRSTVRRVKCETICCPSPGALPDAAHPLICE